MCLLFNHYGLSTFKNVSEKGTSDLLVLDGGSPMECKGCR